MRAEDHQHQAVPAASMLHGAGVQLQDDDTTAGVSAARTKSE